MSFVAKSARFCLSPRMVLFCCFCSRLQKTESLHANVSKRGALSQSCKFSKKGRVGCGLLLGGTCCYELLLCLPGRTQESLEPVKTARGSGWHIMKGNHWHEDPGIMRMESSRMLEGSV